MPKIAVGYMGEFVGNENFQGISVGITIPLWQNKNRVKYARAAALYRSSLDKNNSGEILLKAFEKGELPLLEYLLEMEYFYECFKKLASAERDLACTLAELTAYTL